MDTNNLTESFKKVYSEMGDEFTTRQLFDGLRRLGLRIDRKDKDYSRKKTHLIRLTEERAERIYKGDNTRSATFVKKKVNSQLLNEQKAVEILKSLGYKVLKPVTNFEEI